MKLALIALLLTAAPDGGSPARDAGTSPKKGDGFVYEKPKSATPEGDVPLKMAVEGPDGGVEKATQALQVPAFAKLARSCATIAGGCDATHPCKGCFAVVAEQDPAGTVALKMDRLRPAPKYDDADACLKKYAGPKLFSASKTAQRARIPICF